MRFKEVMPFNQAGGGCRMYVRLKFGSIRVAGGTLILTGLGGAAACVATTAGAPGVRCTGFNPVSARCRPGWPGRVKRLDQEVFIYGYVQTFYIRLLDRW
ncbi:hypothetical protein A6M21_05055 [Desulfotomaculum copahuensis]|uniref:Uncharacterized protein n=1 Tax=Desulfotomaculum copahuensis TaxID=1838280 RepID=A0A1B7LHW3_9FIRM|nr:hypothetical protein A6M21_05055 [Desulfotomaculum copahuensis]